MMTLSFHRTSVRLLDGFDDPTLDPVSWQRLLDERGSTNVVFLTRWWQQTWWDIFGRGCLLLIGVFRGDDLVGIAPLFADSGMIFFIGSGGSDYLDFIGTMGSPAVLAEVLDTARGTIPDFVGFRFYHIPDESVTGRWLQTAAQRLDFACYDEGELPAPAVRLVETGDSVAQKKRLRRHQRYFEREGRLNVRHLRHADDIIPRLEAFFDQHIARWATTLYPSLFLDPNQRRFYRSLANADQTAPWLRFTELEWNERSIAFHFGFSYRETYMYYKPTFDIQLARHSPGQVLIRQVLLEALEEGAKEFDLGLGDETFKQRFASYTRLVRTWGLYPR